MRGGFVEGLMGENASGLAPEISRSSLDLLLDRARQGEVDAFEGLMIATQRRVLSTSWRLLGDADRARDAAQEVYLRVFRSLRSFRPDGDFHAWLYGITVNVCRDSRRRRTADASRFTSLGEPLQAGETREVGTPATAEEDLLAEERRKHLFAALDTLPPGERAALVLRDLEGMTSEQAARALGSRPGTVRAQISSARTKVRRYCERVFAGKNGVMR
jgi:RNA polymerase sigma-70 factor (ECF subfamily)